MPLERSGKAAAERSSRKSGDLPSTVVNTGPSAGVCRWNAANPRNEVGDERSEARADARCPLGGPRVSRSIFALAAVLALAVLPASAQAPRITIGQTFMAGSTDPGEGSAGWALASHGVAEKLFTVDAAGGLAGHLAESASRADDGSWIITLRPGHKFADGTPVTAAEVAAGLTRTNERNAAARASVGRMTLEAIDPTTLRIRTERPTPVMPAVLAEWPFAVYRVSEKPVFTGPYQVAALRAGDGIDLVPNPNFPDAAKRGPVLLKRFPDGQSMAVALEAGELDIAFNLPVESLSRLKARNITVKTFLVGYQYMLWQNTRREALADPRVRQAVDLALDRNELVTAIQGGEPANGAFPRGTPYALEEPRPTDATASNRLLDEAGWKRGPDGRRMKDGKPLDLVVTAYPQRPDLVTMQPVVRARLSSLGIGVQTRVVEQAGPVAAAGDFDLLLWAQHTLPAGDPGFFLNGFFRSGAGNNYAGFSSPEVDRLLDRLGGTGTGIERVAAAAEVQREIFRSAPVSFLLTPAWHVGLGPRMVGYQPWGADYNIIRADFGL